jgi:hypothetical protein
MTRRPVRFTYPIVQRIQWSKASNGPTDLYTCNGLVAMPYEYAPLAHDLHTPWLQHSLPGLCHASGFRVPTLTSSHQT